MVPLYTEVSSFQGVVPQSVTIQKTHVGELPFGGNLLHIDQDI